MGDGIQTQLKISLNWIFNLGIFLYVHSFGGFVCLFISFWGFFFGSFDFFLRISLKGWSYLTTDKGLLSAVFKSQSHFCVDDIHVCI